MSASTITVKQQSFVRSLLLERLDALEITDLDEYIKTQSINTLTGQGASKLIEALKSIPCSKKSEHAHLPEGRVIANRYGNKCTLCNSYVEAGDGWAVQTAGGWRTFHSAGQCVAVDVSAPSIEVESGKTYRLEDGTIAVAYTTQNGRLASRRLIIDEDGTGHLEYWQGGVAKIKAYGALLTQEEASRIGRLHRFCVSCCRDLTDDRSLSAGYGQTCASNNGWWYPSLKEAKELLQRDVTL